MTFISPKEDESAIPLFQPDTPFLIAMRTVAAMQEMQTKWWQAWTGIMLPSVQTKAPKTDADAESDTAE
ncbi:hypothetical protein [Novosphingobium sp. PC22D]|uniref:hypothetical protein n=1 Tax=Novosphingobium sp. PC22D TaxID=1962403 RepID=UPI0011453218|nr:hypothetical protein [Novosphingobium sp. PC22D]